MQSQPPNYQQQQPMDPNAPRGAAQAYYGNPPQTEGYYGEQSHGAKGMAQQQQPPLHPIPNQSGGGMQQQGSYPPGPPANYPQQGQPQHFQQVDQTRENNKESSHGCLTCLLCCGGTCLCCDLLC